MRRTPLITIILISALSCSGAVASKPSQPQTEIAIRRPERPINSVMHYEASCGPHRYGLMLQYRHDDPSRRLHAVTVNGREIAASEKDRILGLLTPMTSIMEAKIDQCSDAHSNRARFRLLVTEPPAPGVPLRFLDFWVGPDGTVSDVRFN